MQTCIKLQQPQSQLSIGLSIAEKWIDFVYISDLSCLVPKEAEFQLSHNKIKIFVFLVTLVLPWLQDNPFSLEEIFEENFELECHWRNFKAATCNLHDGVSMNFNLFCIHAKKKP
jgi:hypothetical protein